MPPFHAIAERKVPHIGTYRRVLPVSTERLYENAIDWEHLPYLHRSSFARVECLEAGAWGFRARVWGRSYEERPSSVIELRLDRECRRWITSTLEGPGQGSEIWTHAFPVADRETHIVVDYFVPGIAPERAAARFEAYENLYTRLYDEDVGMMSSRQAQLDALANRDTASTIGQVMLGTLEHVRSRLPMTIEQRGRRFRIVELDGKLVAYSTICPHALGPLDAAVVTNGVVECPWHGLRFDIFSGRCVSGRDCRLPPAPQIVVDSSGVICLEWSAEAF